MKIMKMLIPFIILIYAFSAFGQTKTDCTLNYSQLPSVRGLKLGMTKKQVLAIYPKLVLKKSVFYTSKGSADGNLEQTSVSNEEYRKKLNSISVSLNANILSDVTLFYDDSTRELSTEEFVTEITKTLNLPAKAWGNKDTSLFSESYVMICNNFSVVASKPEGGNVRLKISRLGFSMKPFRRPIPSSN